jgi:hypothetical protein
MIIEKVYIYHWTNKPQGTNHTPDSDHWFVLRKAKSIYIQLDTLTDTNNTSTDIDLNIYTDMNTLDWDTIPYAEKNIGNDQIKSFLITPGPYRMLLRLDNNAAGTRADVYARVYVQYEE